MSYLQAKARNPAEGTEGIVAVIAPWSEGRVRVHMLREGGMPFGSSAPETEEQAKYSCQERLGIGPGEWETHEGEPFWLPILWSAHEDAVAEFPSEDGADPADGDVTPHRSARTTLVRLACFAAVWLIAFGVRLAQRSDERLLTKAGLFFAFLVPTVLGFWLIQRAARYRLPWWVELFAMPFAAGGLVYTAAAVRDLLGRTT